MNNETQKKISDLSAWEKNPRKITAAQARILRSTMEKYGDLSGIVFNSALGKLVGGHQRKTQLPDSAPITITDSFDPPTAHGTVCEGYIEWNGERYKYREVRWPDEKFHAAAAIAANEAGGDWEWAELKNILVELDDGSFNLEETGFEMHELENLFAGENSPGAGQDSRGLDYSSLDGSPVDAQIAGMIDGVRKAIQIEFKLEHYDEAVDLVRFWRMQEAYIGLMFLNFLKAEKEKLSNKE